MILWNPETWNKKRKAFLGIVSVRTMYVKLNPIKFILK